MAEEMDSKTPAPSSVTSDSNDEPPVPLLPESTTFDHRRATNPRDHRYRLRQLLAREELSEAMITEIVRAYPKTCKYQYLFSYPHKRKTVELCPLAQICCLKPSLDLVMLVHETYPEAIAGKDKIGRLPLHYACRFDASKAVVDYLIQQYGNAVRIQTSEGVLPLHYACRNQSVDVVHDLISLYPESVKASNWLSWLPLHYACCQEKESQSHALISYLVSLYPDACMAKTNSGSLPIHYAAGGASFRAIKTLLSTHPDGIKARNQSKNLPLHHACYEQAPIEVINLLVQMYPVSVACVSSKGTTPLQIVTENESPAAVLIYLARVESALDTLDSLPFNVRCETLDDMMKEALKETEGKTERVSKGHQQEDKFEVDAVDTTNNSTSEQVNEPSQRTQATVASSIHTAATTRTMPGAVRIRGPGVDSSDDDGDDDNVSHAESETKSADKEMIVASEISPEVTELEAELESYRQRFRDEVVVADDAVIIPAENPSLHSKCCIIL